MPKREDRALSQISKARHLLAEAKTVYQVKTIGDIAVAARAFAKANNMSLDAKNEAAELVVMTERKWGQFRPWVCEWLPSHASKYVLSSRGYGLTLNVAIPVKDIPGDIINKNTIKRGSPLFAKFHATLRVAGWYGREIKPY